MKRIYSSQNLGMVHNLKNILENNGIASQVRGEHLNDAAGGVAPTDAWVELWLVDEQQYNKAEAIVEEVLDDADPQSTDEGDAEPWTCSNCGEEVDGNLGVCWNCGREAPEAQ